MAQSDRGQSKNLEVTIDDVERVLAVGRLLMSVLTPEELDQLRDALANRTPFRVGDVQSEHEIGNAGVS